MPDGPVDHIRRLLGDVVQAGWSLAIDLGTIRPGHRRARRFARFGDRSAVCFPVAAMFGESSIEVGEGCIIGPYATLSAGVSPEQVLDGPVVTIGDRCVIGKGSGVVGHRWSKVLGHGPVRVRMEKEPRGLVERRDVGCGLVRVGTGLPAIALKV